MTLSVKLSSYSQSTWWNQYSCAQIVFFSFIKEQYSYSNRKKKNQSEKKNLRVKDIQWSCQPNCQVNTLLLNLFSFPLYCYKGTVSYTNRKKKNQSEKKNLRLKDIHWSCPPNCQVNTLLLKLFSFLWYFYKGTVQLYQ